MNNKIWVLGLEYPAECSGGRGIVFHYRDSTTSFEERDFSKTLHRTDGPAIEYGDGKTEWWIDGRFVRSLSTQVLFNYMKVKDLTMAHLLTDTDETVRRGAELYVRYNI